ncbi:MAG: flippase-like domain-containing protein, partial [Actinobacteria bacterium]|nr:flippase-like domain-containing protein [Actinomycetota bacterium]
MSEPSTAQEEAQEAAAASAEISDRRLLRRFLSLRTLLSFAVAVALLAVAWVLQDIKFEDVLAELRRANPWLIVLAYVTFGLTFPLRIVRWRLLLNNAAHREHVRPDYRNWRLFQILYISWFVNGALPLKLGDIYRAFMARANFATSLTRTLGTIASERVFDISTLIVLVLISSAFVSHSGRFGEDVGRI